LTCGKLAAFARPDGASTSKNALYTALASETTSSAALKIAGNRCPHLLSPLRIRNRVLKNRILHTVAPTYFMQGPENFPSELYRMHYSNMAKNAAIVSINTHYGTSANRFDVKEDINNDSAFYHYSDRTWDEIPTVYNYVNEMIDDIHYQGSLILFGGNTGSFSPKDLDATGAPNEAMRKRMAEQEKPQTDEEILAEAKDHVKKGYDVYTLRTPSLEAAKRLRDETNLILLGRLSNPMEGEVHAPPQPSAAELDEAVRQARKLEGLIDIFWIRVDGHPNGWDQDEGRPKALAYAEAIKKAGIKVITCPSAGFHDPVENDEFIASGKTDMVGMTTPFFSDPELVRKVQEGRADDVLQCIGCQDCHGISYSNPPWYSTCAVNPTWGLPPYQLKSITQPKVSKTVAVIGGGPAGMKAALIAAERGHKVTIYEKSDALGGQQKISDYTQTRWTFRKLKDYLAYQVKKQGIEVLLSTKATPEMVKAKGYDTVLVANGAATVFSEWESQGNANVFNLMDTYTNKKALGKNIVVIGAGKFAVEAAVTMLLDGHKVSMLAPGKELVEPELEGPHNMRAQERIYNNSPDFSSVLETKVKNISAGKVTYTDSTGKENSVQADSIVIWSGLKPRLDEAEKYIGSADQVFFLGDCTGICGTLQKTFRNAFFVASQV
jgi:2,4-dienoyl-CoA reductase-like NADH-dependent reductase (Old Yellow Enzyme family)/thioredoxin reductase